VCPAFEPHHFGKRHLSVPRTSNCQSVPQAAVSHSACRGPVSCAAGSPTAGLPSSATESRSVITRESRSVRFACTAGLTLSRPGRHGRWRCRDTGLIVTNSGPRSPGSPR